MIIKKTSMKKFYSTLLCAFIAISSTAQLNGVLDETFANGGIYTSDAGFVDVLHAIKIQDDGKILASGVALNANFEGQAKVIRLLPDGSPDATFGTDGIVSLELNLESYGYDLLLKENGKILVTGLSSIQPYQFVMMITQLNEDGTVDTSFGTNGSTIVNLGTGDEYAYGMTLQPDGKILIVGNSLDANYLNVPTVLRLTEDGDLDDTFGGDGVVFYPVTEVENELWCVSLQSDGKIVVGGHYAPDLFDVDVLLVRFNEDGTLDETFGENGAVKDALNDGGFAECYDMAIDANDNIIITGYAASSQGNDAFVKKYDPDGAADLSFGTNGEVYSGIESFDVANAMYMTEDGRILITGTAGDFFSDQTFALWSFDSDGSPSADFGTNGAVYTNLGGETEEATSIAVQDDSYILIAGKSRNTTNNFDFAILRYQDGLTDIKENDQETSFNVFPNPIKSGETITMAAKHKNANITRIDCVSQEGKLVFSNSVNALNSSYQTTMDLPAGCYDVQFFDQDHYVDSMKLVVTE